MVTLGGFSLSVVEKLGWRGFVGCAAVAAERSLSEALGFGFVGARKLSSQYQSLKREKRRKRQKKRKSSLFRRAQMSEIKAKQKQKPIPSRLLIMPCCIPFFFPVCVFQVMDTDGREKRVAARKRGR